MLAIGMQRHLVTGGIPFGDGGVGFHGVLVDRRKCIFSLDHDIGRGEGSIQIAPGKLMVVADIARIELEFAQPVEKPLAQQLGDMQMGRIFGEGFVDGKRCHHRLVVDLDQLGGVGGDFRGLGGDRHHRLAREPHPIDGDQGAVLDGMPVVGIDVEHIVARHDGDYTR